jgi:hypothetical protein
VNADDPLLDRATIEDAFRRLGDRLARLGVVADLYVFGGAAMALAYDSRRATRDIDAVFSRTVWCWNRRACTSHQRSLTTLAYALPPHCQSTSWR